MKKKTYAVTTILMAVILVAICAVFLVRVKSMEGQLEAYKLTADEAAQALIERDEMALKLEESENYVGAIRTERDEVNVVLESIQSERDAANESLDSVQAERDAANAIAEAVKVERDILYKRLDEANARIAELEAQMGVSPTTEPFTVDMTEETAEPEATAEASAEPGVTVEPEASVEPEVSAESEAAEEPEASAETEATEVPEADETAEADGDAPEATEEPVPTRGPTGIH